MYARTAGDETLTFFVSGMLWRRSLVMQDKPTGTLWSHILGEAIEGKLEGRRLDTLPSVMTTWKDWLRTHPDTTVLSLRRTSKEFVRDFYARRKPGRFVFGWLVERKAFHVRLDALLGKTLVNCTCERTPLLVVFEPDSTATRLFSRRVGDRVLGFAMASKGLLRDKQTGSTWNPATGVALAGPLAGKQLAHEVGIMSYAQAWKAFHPDSEEAIQR